MEGFEPVPPDTGSMGGRPTSSHPPEPTSSQPPEPTSTQPPEPTSSQPPEPTSTQPPEPTSTQPREPTSSHPPEPTSSQPPEPTSTQPPEPTSSHPPEPTSSQPPEPTSTQPPEPTSTQPREPTSTQPREPTSTQPREPTSSHPLESQKVVQVKTAVYENSSLQAARDAEVVTGGEDAGESRPGGDGGASRPETADLKPASHRPCSHGHGHGAGGTRQPAFRQKATATGRESGTRGNSPDDAGCSGTAQVMGKCREGPKAGQTDSGPWPRADTRRADNRSRPGEERATKYDKGTRKNNRKGSRDFEENEHPSFKAFQKSGHYTDAAAAATRSDAVKTGHKRDRMRRNASTRPDVQAERDTTHKSQSRNDSAGNPSAPRNNRDAASVTSTQDEKDTAPRSSNRRSKRNTPSRFTNDKTGHYSASESKNRAAAKGPHTVGPSSNLESGKDNGPLSSHPKKENDISRRSSTSHNDISRRSSTSHNDISRRSSTSHNGKPGSGQQTRADAVPKPSNPQSRKSQRGAACADRPPKPSGPKETKLFFRVHQEFQDANALTSFITRRVGAVGDSLPLTQDQVRCREGFTFSTLTCASRNKATKILESLNRDNTKSDPRIDCASTAFPTVVGRQESLQDRRNLMIGDTLVMFDADSDRHVRKNKQKRDDLQRNIETEKRRRRDLYTHEDALQKTRRLEQQQLELRQQLAEFTGSRDSMKEQLQSTSQEDFAKDIRILRKRFRRECERLDAALPIYGKRGEILQTVREHPVTVIKGETGSGKSTQLVQYLHESSDMGQSGVIVCTQPRRVAATSLASRVAKEMMTTVDQEVGYRLGCRSTQSAATRILYTTDHSLLNECLADPLLKEYSCIIVDEAHERSLHTDLLLSMIKKCLPSRPDLRVIITSATIDPAIFQEFFGGCPIVEVTGRVFPVDVVWPEEDDDSLQENYCDLAVKKVIEIHAQQPEGDILVFVTSPAETEKCSQLLKDKLRNARGAFKCFQLHGKQRAEDQRLVFEPLKRTLRKIVFATNCAETSLTIDGTRYVVDTGLAKEMRYDPQRNLNALRLSFISQSSANQRKGRAGRTAPGKCYRLFSEKTYEDMEKVSLPEILRIHLGHALLKLAELGVDEDSYEFVQSPSKASIRNALDMLESLGALQDGQVTEKGQWIAKLPFDPRLGLLTYLGGGRGVLYDSIVLAAVMSAEGSVFYRGTSEEDQRRHDLTKIRISTDEGDCMSSLYVYQVWLDVPDQEQNAWCMDNSLNAKALRGVRETVREVCQTLKADLPAQQFSEDPSTQELLRRLIVTCYASNLCRYLGQANAGYVTAHNSLRVHFHPSSCLSALGSLPQWVVFVQLTQTSRDFITGITPVEESWLEDLDDRALGFISLQGLRQISIRKTFSCSVGSRAFFNIVGTRFSKLRELEAAFHSPHSVLFVEANRDLGQVYVYSSGDTDQAASLEEELEKIMQQTVDDAEQEDREESVAGANKQDVRVVLGLGGEVKGILMPDQTRRVYVKVKNNNHSRPALGDRKTTDESSPNDTTEDKVKAKFAQFGDIQFCKRFDEGHQWGFLVFKTPKQAEDAERETSGHAYLTGELERRYPPKNSTSFQLVLKWSRLPCQGHAIVHVSKKFFSRCLRLRAFYVDTVPVTISAEPKRPEYWYRLRLDNITNAMTEDLIRRSLLHALRRREEEEDIVLDVLIPRKEPVVREDGMDEFRKEAVQQIRLVLLPYVKRSLDVEMPNPRQDDVMFTAIIRFQDAVEGHTAYEKLRFSGEMQSAVRNFTRATVHHHHHHHHDHDDDDDDDEEEEEEEEGAGAYGGRDWANAEERGVDDPVQLEMMSVATGTVHIHRQNWDLSSRDVGEAVQFLQTHLDVRIDNADDDDDDVDVNRGSGVVLTIRADSLEKIVQAKSLVDVVIRGETVDCAEALVLFTAKGKVILQQMEEGTDATLSIDRRFRKVTIRGERRARAVLRDRLEELVQRERHSEEHGLRGGDTPPGLMKEVIIRYGEDLTRLLEDCGLQSASLDFHRQKLKVTGDPESLQKATKLLSKLTEEVRRETQEQRGEAGQEAEEPCSVCLCPIPRGQMHRLELCVHPYCMDCLRQQVRCAVSSQTLPVTCCLEGCERPLAWRDLSNLIRLGHLDQPSFTKAAVAAYVKGRPEEYRYCPTADCPAVYRAFAPPPPTRRAAATRRFGQRMTTQPTRWLSAPTRDLDPFVCPACGVSTCRCCHNPVHRGQPCPTGSAEEEEEESGAAAARSDAELRRWAEEDPANRKRCPQCRSLIERLQGCNKMYCTACRTVFCFVCCQKFSSSGECYNHLVAKHGGIFPDDAVYRHDAQRRHPVAARARDALERVRAIGARERIAMDGLLARRLADRMARPGAYRF